MLLRFVDDFALFAKSFDAAMKLKEVTVALLTDMGLHIHPTKGYHTAVQVVDHLGMTLELKKSEFRAPQAKLSSIAALAKQMLVRSSKKKRWVPVKSLASLAVKTHILHLTISFAMFYLRELHDVVKSAESWTRTVRITIQLKRDLEW